jgi:hypothetical protein
LFGGDADPDGGLLFEQVGCHILWCMVFVDVGLIATALAVRRADTLKVTALGYNEIRERGENR